MRTRRAAKDAAETDADEEEEDDRKAGSEKDYRSLGYTPKSDSAKVWGRLPRFARAPARCCWREHPFGNFQLCDEPGAITKKKKKKKGVVQVAHGFSDSEESDGTLTSLGLRRAPPRGRRLSPPPTSDAEAGRKCFGTGGWGKRLRGRTGRGSSVTNLSAGREGPSG